MSQLCRIIYTVDCLRASRDIIKNDKCSWLRVCNLIVGIAYRLIGFHRQQS